MAEEALPKSPRKAAPRPDEGYTVKLYFTGYCDKLDKWFFENQPVSGIAFISPWLQCQIDAGLGEIVN